MDGKKPHQITDFPSGRIFSFAWSRDGKSLFIKETRPATES